MFERVLKLSLPTLYFWLAMFYVLFHLWLNILGELTTFADREYYKVGAACRARRSVAQHVEHAERGAAREAWEHAQHVASAGRGGASGLAGGPSSCHRVGNGWGCRGVVGEVGGGTGAYMEGLRACVKGCTKAPVEIPPPPSLYPEPNYPIARPPPLPGVVERHHHWRVLAALEHARAQVDAAPRLLPLHPPRHPKVLRGWVGGRAGEWMDGRGCKPCGGASHAGVGVGWTGWRCQGVDLWMRQGATAAVVGQQPAQRNVARRPGCCVLL